MNTVGDQLPVEIQRVQALMKLYGGLSGGVGKPAAYLMDLALKRAQAAILEGDVVAMVRALVDLQGFTG